MLCFAPVLYRATHSAYNKKRKTNPCRFASTTNKHSDVTFDCAVTSPIKFKLREPQ